MQTESSRVTGLARLTAEDLSIWNQHYIGTFFIINDVKEATKYAAGRLLDIGCGNKPYFQFFKNKVSEYIGCDIVQSSENLVDYICPANKLPFEDNSFDTIFSTQVMEHVADFHGMASESFRVLRKNGYGIFTMPFSWELHEEPYDFFRFSKHGLKYLFEKTGFEIVEIKANGGKWAAVSQLFLNTLFSTRKYRTIRSRLIKLIFIHFRFLYLYNKISIWLDKRYFDDLFTLNYIVIVKKPGEQ